MNETRTPLVLVERGESKVWIFDDRLASQVVGLDWSVPVIDAVDVKPIKSIKPKKTKKWEGLHGLFAQPSGRIWSTKADRLERIKMMRRVLSILWFSRHVGPVSVYELMDRIGYKKGQISLSRIMHSEAQRMARFFHMQEGAIYACKGDAYSPGEMIRIVLDRFGGPIDEPAKKPTEMPTEMSTVDS